MNALKLLGATALIMVGLFLTAVIGDIMFPLDQRSIEVTITPDMVIYPEIAWEDDISNPDNQPYVLEVAFNLDIPVDSVTQAQFNMRYVRSTPYYLREQ